MKNFVKKIAKISQYITLASRYLSVHNLKVRSMRFSPYVYVLRVVFFLLVNFIRGEKKSESGADAREWE